jgi:peptidoglycan/xylan/chitin deacetylase (PgdA/CDA1 family)
MLSASGPALVLAIKGYIAGTLLLAAATALIAAGALRWCAGVPNASARLRRVLLMLAAGQGAALTAVFQTLGWAYVNLGSLHDERLYFHLLVTVPLFLGTLELSLALLPPILRANLIVFVLLWIATEMIFGRLLPPEVDGEPVSLVQSQYYESNAAVGYGIAPNSQALHVKRLGSRPVISATYVIDGFGWRQTLSYAADGRTNFLLFFGDSNTFGEGVNQTETLPYQVAQLAPRYHPYNYALSGYGPAQALDLIGSRDLRKEVAEPQGDALFVFLPTLIDRVRGGSPVSAGWGRRFSDYEIDADGRLVRRGDFVHGRQLLTLFYYLVNCSNVASYFQLTFPRQLSDGDFELTARVLAKSQHELERRLTVHNFYVVLAPVSTGEALISRRLIPYLRAQGLHYVDLTDMFDASRPGYRLPDYHLSALSDRLIAKRLVRDLKIGAPATSDPLDPSEPITPIQVAVTVDDLPFQAPKVSWEGLMAIECKIAASLKRSAVREPYGFVIGRDTATFPDSDAALNDWLEEGYPLGNHTWSHRCLSAITAADFVADIERNDRLLESITRGSPFIQQRRTFRYPCLQEGDTLEKREAVRNYLLHNGYRIAEVTIDYSDYLWDEAYLRCEAQHNANAVQWLKLQMMEAVRRHLRGSQKLARLIFGRDIKHVLLIHLSTLNSAALDDVLATMRADGVKFVTLEEALSDPAYGNDPAATSGQGATFLQLMIAARHLVDPYKDTLFTQELLSRICRQNG